MLSCDVEGGGSGMLTSAAVVQPLQPTGASRLCVVAPVSFLMSADWMYGVSALEDWVGVASAWCLVHQL